jgi:hypothetical protein
VTAKILQFPPQPGAIRTRALPASPYERECAVHGTWRLDHSPRGCPFCPGGRFAEGACRADNGGAIPGHPQPPVWGTCAGCGAPHAGPARLPCGGDPGAGAVPCCDHCSHPCECAPCLHRAADTARLGQPYEDLLRGDGLIGDDPNLDCAEHGFIYTIGSVGCPDCRAAMDVPAPTEPPF